MSKGARIRSDWERTKEREFNHIEFAQHTVKKTIFDVARGAQETFFYKNIPEVIRDYFPRLISAEESLDRVSYEMQMIPSRDLAIWYLHNAITTDVLSDVLAQIDFYIQELPWLEVSNDRWLHSTRELVLSKLKNRWHLYRQTPTYASLDRRFRMTRGLSLEEIYTQISSRVSEKIQATGGTRLHFSHGDLCFSNILWNSQRELKFVDPKGAFTKSGLYFTLYYDLAKLSHSILGNYDGIIGAQNIEFSPQQHLFESWLKGMGYNVQLVRAIEATLFLSLLPLHMDRLDAHEAFITAAMGAHSASFK